MRYFIRIIPNGNFGDGTVFVKNSDTGESATVRNLDQMKKWIEQDLKNEDDLLTKERESAKIKKIPEGENS